MTFEEAKDALWRLVSACNYRDAVMASGHDDKLDYAVENYAAAISKAQRLLEGIEGTVSESDG